jgi:hypothetical protein
MKFLTGSRNNPSGREVRWYRKEDLFCLPFETRTVVEQENASDEALRVAVIEILANRAVAEAGGPEAMTPHRANMLAETALRALQITFETEGLEFSTFLAGGEPNDEEYSVADSVDRAMDQLQLSGDEQVSSKQIIVRMLRYTIYESSAEERLYIGRMSRTYLLLFSLNSEPRIVEYFQNMASDFYLYIGADILIHALSERYLRPEDQMTTNLLQMLAQAGAHLVLAEPALDEVHSNLETSDWEYQNYFSAVDAHVTVDIARHASKILIRAYFYARLLPADKRNQPRNWQHYIEQFCSYEHLHRPNGKDEIKSYLINKFKMRYESRSDLTTLCDAELLETLTAKLAAFKKKQILAENDALMILATYGRRDNLKEHSSSTSFGYRTWWLTHEVRVRKHTADLFKKRGS